MLGKFLYSLRRLKMKKLMSFFMVALMLAALLATGVSAERTNMELTVPKFTKAPTLDGVISEEEWGEKTLTMVTAGAATETSEEIGRNDEYGLINTFYWYAVEGTCDSFSYDVWFRWDADYLYVAAKVNDPDGFALIGGGADIWNGDMFQIRVDEKGPSAAMLETNPEFDYTTDAYDGETYNKPWSDDSSVFNAIMGLAYGTDPTFWVGQGKNLPDGGDYLDTVGITYKNSDDGMTATICYEGAIPWSYIDPVLVPKVGDVYGCCVVACATDSNALTAWLQWGHGICSMSPDSTQPIPTRGGSQGIVLGDAEVTPADEYPVIGDEPIDTTEDPNDDTPVTLTPPKPVVTTGSNNDTPAGTTASDDGGLPVGAIIGIVAGVLVVVAVVVIIIVKKKKN